MTAWAQELIDEASYTYVEATVSGKGLRIVGSAEGDYLDNSFPAPDGGEIELYRHATRYITDQRNADRQLRRTAKHRRTDRAHPREVRWATGTARSRSTTEISTADASRHRYRRRC